MIYLIDLSDLNAKMLEILKINPKILEINAGLNAKYWINHMDC